jgi:FKBP-type peptidyl-prolyl cis-trans isomerase
MPAPSSKPDRIARALLALPLALALALGAAAQEAKPAAPPDAQSPAGASSAPASGGLAMQPVPEPPKPTPIPVPDLPIVQAKTLDNGIVIEDMKLGDGYEVKPGGAVVAHYHGTLRAEPTKVIDSSFQRGEPAGFSLSPLTQNRVIEGWQLGVPGMKVGGIRRLTVPAKMGWGERGNGKDIPPNADVVFVIQLVDAIQIEDVVVGTGDTAAQVSVAITAHTVKDGDGNVLATIDAAKPYIWIPGEHEGVMLGLPGMKVGGKRKLKIPAQFNVSPPQAKSSLPQNVPCEIELELLNLRNLQ